MPTINSPNNKTRNQDDQGRKDTKKANTAANTAEPKEYHEKPI
jgi:hypothetical protein